QQQDSVPVAEIGVSRNGAQYELQSSGALWQWTGGNALVGQMSPWNLLDTVAAAFVVSTNSALYETTSGGGLWRLFGNATTMPSLQNWTLVFTSASVGSSTGSAQNGVGGGTPLYALPDGTVVTIVNGGFEQITADQVFQDALGQNNILWGNFAAPGLIDNPGQNLFTPAFNPVLVLGGQFSNFTGTGSTTFGPFLF